jgi:hypothetical protein
VLLLVFVNVAYPINQPFYWTKDPAQKNPLSGKYPGHVDPKRLGYGKQNQKVYSELQKSVKCHLIFSIIYVTGLSSANDENFNPSPPPFRKGGMEGFETYFLNKGLLNPHAAQNFSGLSSAYVK